MDIQKILRTIRKYYRRMRRPKTYDEKVMVRLILTVAFLTLLVNVTGYAKPLDDKDKSEKTKAESTTEEKITTESSNKSDVATAQDAERSTGLILESETEPSTGLILEGDTDSTNSEKKVEEGASGALNSIHNLVSDTEPPKIEGAKDIVATMNENVSYRDGITLSDNEDAPENIGLTIDNSEVNLAVEGSYPVTYTATDSSGNSTSVLIMVTVKDNADIVKYVDEKVDKILASILKGKKTDFDKLYAIWHYVYKNVNYVGSASDREIYQAAYDAFKKGTGDCYYYFAVSKLLLEKAGFETIDLERTDGTHFWNLVKYDGQWYHFDACWHDKDYSKYKTFLITEKEAVAYGEWIKRTNYYEYVHDGVPETATESLNWNKFKLPTLDD